MISPLMAIQQAAMDVSNPAPVAPPGVDPGLAAALGQIGPAGVGVNTSQYDPSSWNVYMGPGGVHQSSSGSSAAAAENAMRQGLHDDSIVSIDQAASLPYTWSNDEINSAIKKFKAAGYNINGFDDLVGAWGNLTKAAAGRYTLGGIKVTPWDMLELQRKQGTGAAGSTQTSTSRTVSEISVGTAWSALRSVVKDQLGRDPSDQEVRDFTYRMQSLAAKNPSISTTTQTTDANGNSTSNTTSKQGFTGDDLAKAAMEDAQADPDWAEHQAATTYFNAAIQSLGAIGG